MSFYASNMKGVELEIYVATRSKNSGQVISTDITGFSYKGSLKLNEYFEIKELNRSNVIVYLLIIPKSDFPTLTIKTSKWKRNESYFQR